VKRAGDTIVYVLAVGIISGVAYGILENPPSRFLIGAGTAAILSIAFHMRRKSTVSVLALCLCLGFACGLLRATQVQKVIPEGFASLLDSKVEFQGTVDQMPDVREGKKRLTILVTKHGESTHVVAAISLYQDLHVGDLVLLRGKLSAPKSFETSGGRSFFYDKFLAKDDVYAVIDPASVRAVGRSRSEWLALLRVLETIKDACEESLQLAIPEPESALAIGILIGGKQGLGKDLLEAFTISGMLQIVVLSGYNVMIVAEAILLLTSGFSKRTAALFAGTSIVLFILLAGSGSSAVRAGVMAMFALIARATGKSYQVLKVVACAAFLMTLYNPIAAVYDPGLQFSFLATIGLIIGTPLISQKFLWIRNVSVRELLASTLAAQAGVLPILLWQTGNLSLISVFSNMIAMPAIPFAMAFSALAGSVAFASASHFPLLVSLAGLPAYIFLTYVIHVAVVTASLPYAQVIVPYFSFWFVIAAYGALAFVVVRAQRKMPEPRGPGILEMKLRTNVTTSQRQGNDVR
jgi:competence protein ComEC